MNANKKNIKTDSINKNIPSWINEEYQASLIVTGGLGVIGKTLIEFLMRTTQAKVALIDVKKQLSPSQKAFLKRYDKRLTYYCSDCKTLEKTHALLKKIGRSDALVHLAGVFENDMAPRTAKLKEQIYHRAIESNLTNAYNLAEAFISQLPKRAQGKTREADASYRMIFASSLSFRRGAFEHAAYSAAKGGIVGLVRAYSKRYAPHVLVNAVAPGIIDSNMAAPVIRSRGEKLREQIPLKRWGTPLEVAMPICFFLSPASAYITGQTLNIDGGIING